MNKTKYKYYLALFDFVLLDLSLLFSIYFVGHNPDIGFNEAGILTDNMFFSFLILGVVYLFLFQNKQLYKPSIILIKSAHMNAVIKTVLYLSVAFSIAAIILAYSQILQVSILIGTFSVTAFLLLYIYRVRIITPFYLSRGEFSKNILIVGDGSAGATIAETFRNGMEGVNVAGFVTAGTEAKPHGRILGPISELNKIIHEHGINEIVVAYDDRNYEELFSIIDSCKKTNISLKVSAPLFNVICRKIKCEKYGNIPVVNLSQEESFYIKSGMKRVLDFTGALLGIVLLMPLFFIIGLLIKVTSRGPVFFKQMRVGLDGELFKFYKFRSMYQVQGEDEERAKIMKEFIKKEKIEAEDSKVVNLSRVTRVGRIIRKTSIDELPQFFNVLKGEMSLVGPRPEVPYVFELYEEWQKKRVKGLPGCTGIWQVTARSEVTFNEMVLLDVYYLHNISLLLDLKIILKTVPVMFLSRGGK